MKKLITVRKHLRKGKVVKSHTRKASKQKKRNLAVTVASLGSKANAPKPGKYKFDGKKEYLAPHDQGVRAGRQIMYDDSKKDIYTRGGIHSKINKRSWNKGKAV